MKLMDSGSLHQLHVGHTHKLSIGQPIVMMMIIIIMMMMIVIMIVTTTGQLTARDWATYRCVASNDLGDSAASVTLTGITGSDLSRILGLFVVCMALSMAQNNIIKY